LQRYSRRSESDVKKFLSGQDAYTLHKSRRIRFPHRRTYSKGIGDLFQIDLVDLSSLSSFNDGMRYLLTCMNVFSKRAWAVPVRRKSARDVTETFEGILTDQKCNMVQSDKGVVKPGKLLKTQSRTSGGFCPCIGQFPSYCYKYVAFYNFG